MTQQKSKRPQPFGAGAWVKCEVLFALRNRELDTEELVWIGNEQTFPAKDGAYQLQITEELREVLYLDEAKLVVVDREPGTDVHPTDKLLPG